MLLKNEFATLGTRLSGIALSTLLAMAAVPLFVAARADAETITTINGAPIDSAVLDVYVQSRAQGQVDQLEEPERAALLAELKDVFILSTQPETADIVKDPTVAAQLELQERAIIAQAFATRFLAAHQATEEEIVAEYELQVGLTPRMQYRARHILVATQGEAIDLIQQLDQGADFATLATQHSAGPSAQDGGALPWFSPNQMVKPFSDAVAALEDGKYTAKPVQTEFGWHVILREQARPSEPPPLESVRDNIKQNVSHKKFQAHLVGLRAAARESK